MTRTRANFTIARLHRIFALRCVLCCPGTSESISFRLAPQCSALPSTSTSPRNSETFAAALKPDWSLLLCAKKILEATPTGSLCLTVVHCTCTECKSARSSRREVAVRRWQKPIIANTNQNSQNAGCGTLFCGENKTVACRRQPQSVSLNKPVCADCSVVRCSESRTAHLSSIRKIQKILL